MYADFFIPEALFGQLYSYSLSKSSKIGLFGAILISKHARPKHVGNTRILRKVQST